jgi:hypothetical protein
VVPTDADLRLLPRYSLPPVMHSPRAYPGKGLEMRPALVTMHRRGDSQTANSPEPRSQIECGWYSGPSTTDPSATDRTKPSRASSQAVGPGREPKLETRS